MKSSRARIAHYIELWRLSLRGRRPVRADRRWCADEKHIRAPSTILDKTPNQAALGFIHNRDFCTDALFIRTEIMVGARERATT
jgi:hypothetical protein